MNKRMRRAPADRHVRVEPGRENGQRRASSSTGAQIATAASADPRISNPGPPVAEPPVGVSGGVRALSIRLGVLSAAGAAAAALLLYLRTAARGLPAGDSADFITAAWVLGVPHPPG